MSTTLRPRENFRNFADDIFKSIIVNEDKWISVNFWLKFVSKGVINNVSAFVQILAWRRPGDKPLSEPILVILLPHMCVTRPQRVNWLYSKTTSDQFGTVSKKTYCVSVNDGSCYNLSEIGEFISIIKHNNKPTLKFRNGWVMNCIQ